LLNNRIKHMRYVVKVLEVHKQHVFIDANSHEDAISKVENGEGENGNLVYSCTLESDNWSVEDI